MKKVLLALYIIILTSCDKDSNNSQMLESYDYVTVETNSSLFPIVASHEEGETIALRFNEENSELNGIHFNKDEELNYFIETTSEGLPIRGLFNDHLIFFENYTQSTVDLGILTPNGESEIFRNINISDLSTQSLASKVQDDKTVDALKAAGLGVSIFNCALSSALATGTGGIAIPLAVISCSSTLASIIATLDTDDNIIDTGSNALSLYSGSLGCAVSATQLNPVDCIGFFLDVSSLIADNLNSQLNTNLTQADLIEAALRYGSGDVQVTMTWNNTADIDLYVTDPMGETIYYANPFSSSGGQLDIDDVDGHGPENIFWNNGNAPAGNYSVSVNHFSGVSPTNFSVRVQVLGQSAIYNGSVSSDETITVTSFNTLSGLSNKTFLTKSNINVDRPSKK